MSTWVLGLGGSDHDFSAALMCDGDIRVAIEQERLSRRKHGKTYWYESPVQQSIDYCLSSEGISLSDVGLIVSSDTLPVRVRDALRQHEIRLYPHHLCHAASAYMMLPSSPRAGVLVYDGYGSIVDHPTKDSLHCMRETVSFFLFGPGGYECIGRNLGRASLEGDDFPILVTNSVGLLYELTTAILGFDPMDAGKTMGLSSFGRPRYRSLFDKFVTLGATTSDCFQCALDDPALPAEIENALLAGRSEFNVKADLAASVQAVVNETAVRCSSFFSNAAVEYLCISGGCGLNTVANSFLVENIDLPIAIPPHCGDAGLAFGALWLHQFERHRRIPTLTFRGDHLLPHLSRPGRLYSPEERTLAAHQFYPRLSFDPSVRSASDLAHVIAEGSIVALFNGRSEVGPRSLGGRSIIADPRSISTRERINRLIKKREPFRPLAPMVLRSRYGEYFQNLRHADPFMLKVPNALERCAKEAPAVIHIDGTARAQVIDDTGDPFLVALLREFESVTGLGILLNTSFNRRGEPMVESPLDAIDAFVGMGIDGLFLEGEFYRAADKPSA